MDQGPGKLREHFDIGAVKRNWDRAVLPADPPLAGRFAKVRAPRDAYPVARELLDRARRRALGDYAAYAHALVPFLDRAARILAAMEASGADAPPGEQEKAREELLATLTELEDLFEVFAGIGR
jgi:hypothetical protein